MVDKENESAHNNLPSMNSEELMRAVEKAGLLVYKKDDSERRQVKISSGKEAYFALLAQDMLQIAAKYKRSIEDVHRIFYEVNCDRDRLIKSLEGNKV